MIKASEIAEELNLLVLSIQKIISQSNEMSKIELLDDTPDEIYLNFLYNECDISKSGCELDEKILELASFFKAIPKLEERFNILSQFYLSIVSKEIEKHAERAINNSKDFNEQFEESEMNEDIGDFNIEESNEDFLNELNNAIYNNLKTQLSSENSNNLSKQ